MKNAKKCLLMIMVFGFLVSFFTLGVGAKSEDKTEGDFLEEYRDILPDGMDHELEGESVVGMLGFDAILSELASAVLRERGRIVSFFFLLLGSSVLMALAGTVGGELSPLIRSLCSAVTSLLVFTKMMPMISELSASLSEISAFFSMLVPIYTGVMALGGAVTAAGTAGVGMSITLEICSIFSEKFLLMLVFGMFFSSLAGSFGGGFGTASRAVKNIFTRGLALLSTIFVGMLALQTVISASADNMALRAARYATTSIIPIVGGTVSGALSTLVGGAAYAKGMIGGSAVGVIVTLALSPLVTMLMYKLCFFAAVSFLEFCSMDEGAACLGGIRDALDGLISVYTLSVVLYILEVTVMLISGVSY